MLPMAIDCLVIGGGVIGLTTAWRLAQRGISVRLLDQGNLGREASWAGAGILPPAVLGAANAPLNRLTHATNCLWPSISSELRELTGIDNEFHDCGGIELEEPVPSPNEEPHRADLARWRDSGASAEWLSPRELHQLEPAIENREPGILLPDLCQVRNPRHLQALIKACERAGVELVPQCGVIDWRRSDHQIAAAVTSHGELSAAHYIVTAGAWSGKLLATAGITLDVVPLRGQIVLLNPGKKTLTRVIERGKRYLVPRLDGRVLIGSTEEWTGFEKGTTEQGLRDLLAFAEQIVPGISNSPMERTWSGLRPAAVCGHPLIGPLLGVENLIVATGHFRSGLQLSPATAEIVCDSVTGQASTEWSAFCP